MAELGQLTSWGKTKRVLVKCEGSSSTGQLSYEKNFCLCVSSGEEIYNPSEWYMVNLSSNKDKKKEEEEEKARLLLPIPSSEIRGAYMAFCHEQHHQGEDPPILSPFMKLNKFCSYGACCAVVGSTIYRIGGDHRGGNLKGRWSRKVRFLDTNRLDEGWKRGPSTLCGRSNTPVLGVNGKLYVFGGHHPADIPGVWGEFLDTTTGEWNPLPNPPPSLLPPASLASLHFFAAPLTGEYSDKILVCSKLTKALCLYDVEKNIWECLGPLKCGRFLSTPIVVLTSIYWINFQSLFAYDFVQKTLIKMPITDFQICWLLDSYKEDPYEMKPTLVHLVGDDFCLFWIGTDFSSLHCTKIRVSTELMVAFVLSCHSYVFDHKIRLMDCLPSVFSLLRHRVTGSVLRTSCRARIFDDFLDGKMLFFEA
ncbi:unnamed protein product [Camellia sinensis]